MFSGKVFVRLFFGSDSVTTFFDLPQPKCWTGGMSSEPWLVLVLRPSDVWISVLPCFFRGMLDESIFLPGCGVQSSPKEPLRLMIRN